MKLVHIHVDQLAQIEHRLDIRHFQSQIDESFFNLNLNLGIYIFSIVYYTKNSQYFRGGGGETGHWGGGNPRAPPPSK